MPIKIVFFGLEKTGKTKTAKELLGIDINNYKYIPTIGLEVHSVKYENTIFNIWDLAGNSKYSGLIEGYLIQTDIYVLFSSGNETQDLYFFNEYKKYCSKDTKYLIVNTKKENSQQIFNKIYNMSINEKSKI